eukprot:TCONS_00065518-protein
MNFGKNRIVKAKRSIMSSLSTLSPQSKVSAIVDCSNTLTPGSKMAVANQVDTEKTLFNSLSKNRDHVSNAARRMLMSDNEQKSGSVRSAKKSNRRLSWRSLKSASSMDINDITKHYKTKKVYKKDSKKHKLVV